MRPMREKIQVKLNSMASILMDNIIVPNEVQQQGSEEMTASFYDREGNKFSFTLALQVTPKDVTEEEPVEEPTVQELIDQAIAQLGLEQDIASIKDAIAELKAYHKTPQEGTSDNNDG